MESAPRESLVVGAARGSHLGHSVAHSAAPLLGCVPFPPSLFSFLDCPLHRVVAPLVALSAAPLLPGAAPLLHPSAAHFTTLRGPSAVWEKAC